MVRVFDNFAPPEIILGRRPFEYGAVSSNYNLPVWRAEIENDDPLVRALIGALQAKTGDQFQIIQAHINAQTSGLDAAWHTDETEGVTHSLVWYPPEMQWQPEYGGHLLIGDDRSDCRAVLPAPNRAVYLPADAPHCALAPTNRAGSLARYSVAIKIQTFQG